MISVCAHRSPQCAQTPSSHRWCSLPQRRQTQPCHSWDSPKSQPQRRHLAWQAMTSESCASFCTRPQRRQRHPSQSCCSSRASPQRRHLQPSQSWWSRQDSFMVPNSFVLPPALDLPSQAGHAMPRGQVASAASKCRISPAASSRRLMVCAISSRRSSPKRRRIRLTAIRTAVALWPSWAAASA